jgi:alpha,alpha-trehalase
MVEAVLFDMDGVITETAGVHAAAWRRVFDEYLERRARDRHEGLRPFDRDRDYRELVDGRPRYEGVESFLASRGIRLPHGSEADGPDAETVCGLGNRKNRYFHEWLDQHPVKTFPGALKLLDELGRAGVKTAVFSASRNAGAVLRSAGVTGLFDAIVAGEEAAALDLPGKPDPAMLREAAARLGVSPERAAVFEDATAGVEAAVRGGFGLVIGVNRGNNDEALRRAGAHIVVGHLSEITWRPQEGPAVKTLSTLPTFGDRENEIRDRLARKLPALFLDYDGTLTPIVEDYTQAFLAEDMRDTVAELSRHCPVAIVSGRDVEVVRRLVMLESVYYAGSHGFEIRGPREWRRSLEKGVEFLPDLDGAEQELRERLAGVPGHAVERKRFSIAVHYRRAAPEDAGKIESIVDRVLAGHRGLRKGHGKKVFRIQPGIEWDKGHAVLWLLEQLSLNRPDVVPVYVGDDITDEDAFRALAGRGVCLVVRDPDDRPTAADYALADPDDVKRFLQFLTAAVSEGSSRMSGAHE